MLSGDQLADLGRYCAQIHWLCGICCLLFGGFCLSSLNLRLFLLGQPWTWFWTWRKIPGPYSNRCADFHSVLRQYINTKSIQGFLPNLEIRFLLSSSFRYLTKYSKTMIEYKAFSLFSSMSSAASFSQASRFSNKTDNIQGEILHLSA